jgi:hypothetical protein
MDKRSYSSCPGVDHVRHCCTVRKQDGGERIFCIKYGWIRRKIGTQMRYNVEI